MFYQLFELNHAAMAPFRATTEAMRFFMRNPLNPLSQTSFGRTMAASLEFSNVRRAVMESRNSACPPQRSTGIR